MKAREEMHKVSLSDLAEKGSGLRDKGVELRDNVSQAHILKPLAQVFA